MESSEQNLSVKMRVALAAIILLAAFLAAYCKQKKADAVKSPMGKCLEEINRIPEVAALLKSQARDYQDQARPLEGLEIALTVNGMIKSQEDDDDNIDNWCANENRRENLDKFIRALQANHLPPTVDFVVGQAIDKTMLERWLQSGNLLGNMTYSRIKAKKSDPQRFIDDVMANDKLLAPLLEKYAAAKKYFRYPRLKLSRDAQSRDQIKDFLKAKGYVEAMATIEAPDMQFSEIYCAAQARGDETCVNLIKQNFNMLLLDTTLKTRTATRNRTGYDVKLILTVGVNQFTCDYLGEVLAWYQMLGARFISLDEALRDPLYSSVDEKGRPVARAILRETRRLQIESVNAK
ncbi:MAG: polysaccharide deacetylase family protein [Acidobacteria bacterium]|nr:polysaccharide deacetylase family protein [Acidobacteriota bacterium]